MGKTPKPLRIAVTDVELYEHPALVKLREQGHEVFVATDPLDLVIGPRAWYMTPAHLDKYLDLALKAARLRRYPKEEQDGPGNSTDPNEAAAPDSAL